MTEKTNTQDSLKTVFSNNLVRLLYEKGKTQADLYKHLRVSSAAVSDWCNGKKMPRADKLQSIANSLRVEVSDLLNEEHEGSLKLNLFGSKPKTDYVITDNNDRLNTIKDIVIELTDNSFDELLAYSKYLIAKDKNKE